MKSCHVIPRIPGVSNTLRDIPKVSNRELVLSSLSRVSVAHACRPEVENGFPSKMPLAIRGSYMAPPRPRKIGGHCRWLQQYTTEVVPPPDMLRFTCSNVTQLRDFEGIPRVKNRCSRFSDSLLPPPKKAGEVLFPMPLVVLSKMAQSNLGQFRADVCVCAYMFI